MKKKNLLLTFLLAALAFGGVMGQTVTIGSGTTSNQNLPSYSNTNYSLSEQIYTTDEISNAGGYLGKITSIALFNTSYSNKTRNFNIYLVHTNKTSFSSTTDWISVTSENRVFSGNVTLANRSWTTIEFNTPFTWNGSSNIALIVDDNTGSYEYGLGSYVFDASEQSIYVQGATDFDPTNPPTTGTYSAWAVGNVKNIIKLEFESASSCSKPTELKCINHTSNAATLDWTENGTADTWQIVYSTDPDFAPNSATPITVTTKPYTLRGLTTGTTYYAYVRSYCDADNQSAWSNKCEFTPTINSTYTVNNETNTNHLSIPFNCAVTNSNLRSQFIIPSSNLTSMKGGEINRLTFYTTQSSPTGNYGDASFDVYITEVNATTLSSFYDWDNMTLVYSGTVSTSNQQMDLALTTSYMYNGGNLLIGFKQKTTGTNPGYVYWLGVSSTNECSRFYSTYESTSAFLPKTTFTYIPAITFATAGNWNVTDNWYGNVPTSSDNVLIRAAATIPSGVVAQADNITIGDGGSLTIEDGAQLVCNNNPAVTMVKHIDAADWGDNTSGWNFIATPITAVTINNTAHTNLIGGTAEYDLYSFNQSAAVNQWQNYKQNHFTTLENGTGYLYARNADIDVLFMGELAIPSGEINLAYDETAELDMKGWNLVGNPFPCNASVDQSFYVVDGRTIKASTAAAVAPCSGVMVRATAATRTVKFTKAPEASVMASAKSNINMTLTNANERSTETLDNAIISFNEGSELGKFYFGTQNANIYIPQDGNDYAIVSAEAQGEMPVNFKANQDGQYTISVNVEDVEMNYLHLIDNMTGADIDLKATPSYTFNATVNDYASRFRLVFSANGIEETVSDDQPFAFIGNGQIFISNEGEATLQMIDITGRMVSSETISGSCSKNVNVANGIYMLRLVNGENVKTQKIVVR